jgi:Tol biopolymer transport system component
VGQQTISDDDDDDAWYMPPNFYYSSNRYGTWDVIRSPTGLPIETFFSSQSSDIQPAPGPDGFWVAFATNRDGNYEIYKKNRSTGVVVRLTNHGTSDTRPAWYAWRQ